MTTTELPRVSTDWLALRERADAAARSRRLVALLRLRLPSGRPLVVHDLACGSGSMGRWLAPLLPGPQHWILHDRDAELLAVADAELPGRAADGAVVTVETRLSDVTRLEPDELAGASLVTASALLDLLTRDELARLIHACAGAGCPVLFALSVSGRVRLLPADPLDAPIAAAFNAHQCRETLRGRLLGPRAVEAAVEQLREKPVPGTSVPGTGRPAELVVDSTPWRLGRDASELAAEWLIGWVDAACEQEPALAADAALYRRRRLRQAAAGALAVTVGHSDLLVLP